jgi:hypothetical protein
MEASNGNSERYIDRRRFLKLLGAVGISAAVPFTGIQLHRHMTGEGTPTGRITDGTPVRLPFDSSSGIGGFSYIRQEENADIVENPNGSGEVLRIRFPQGNHYGTDFRYQFAEEGYDDLEELYAQYRIYFPSDFQVDGQMGKIPGFGGWYTSSGRGGKPVDGTDSWSARGVAHEAGSNAVNIGYYTYHMDMDGQFGDNFIWEEDLQLGQWYTVTQYVKMNTPGERDGILRGWVDGSQVFEKTDLRFRADGHSDIKVKAYLFNLYWGGSWTSPADNSIYVDNLRLSTQNLAGESGTSSPSQSGASPSTGETGGNPC